MSRPKSPRVIVCCQWCKAELEITEAAMQRGRGAYCGQPCYQASRRGKKRGPYQVVNGQPPRKAPEDRRCRACGGTFLVGGRGNAGWRQRVCSMECQRASRYRRGAKARALSGTEAAWLAGFLDGEGSVMLHGRGTTVALRLTASNTHQPTLEYVLGLTVVGALVWNMNKGRNAKPGGWWLVNGEAAESVLRQTLPFMVTKRKQAELAVAFQERLRDPSFKADRSWQVEWLAEMKAMNRRGAPTAEV